MLYRSEMMEIITYPSDRLRGIVVSPYLALGSGLLALGSWLLWFSWQERPKSQEPGAKSDVRAASRPHIFASLLLFLVDDFRFDDVVRRTARLLTARRRPALRRTLLAVHRFGHLVRGLLQRLRGAAQIVYTALLHRLASFTDRALEVLHIRAGDFLAILAE